MVDYIDRANEIEDRVSRQRERLVTKDHKCPAVGCNNRVSGGVLLEKCDECNTLKKSIEKGKIESESLKVLAGNLCVDCGCDISHLHGSARRCKKCLKTYQSIYRKKWYKDKMNKENTLPATPNQKDTKEISKTSAFKPAVKSIDIENREKTIIDLAFAFDDLMFKVLANGVFVQGDGYDEIETDIKKIREKILNLK